MLELSSLEDDELLCWGRPVIFGSGEAGVFAVVDVAMAERLARCQHINRIHSSLALCHDWKARRRRRTASRLRHVQARKFDSSRWAGAWSAGLRRAPPEQFPSGQH